MKTFYKQKNIINNILQEQQIDVNKQYRLLHFCMIKKIDENTVIFNNLTKEMSVLSFDEVQAISKLPDFSNDIILPLIKKWYLVPVDNDDCKLSDQLFETSKLFENEGYLDSFVILTTTDCNARCFYCYEHGVTRNNMDSQTALDVANFIIKKSYGHKVSIKWFGGEPLYNSSVIDIISNRLAEKGIEFSARMTSNGYLFDKELILKAKNDWHISGVQITLDGTEDTYNKIKSYIYKDVGSPFQKVINNIVELLNAGIKLEIRMNVSDENRNDLYKLVDYLSERLTDKDNIILYAANLFDLYKNRSSIENIRMMQEYFKLCNHIQSRGFKFYDFLDRSISLERGCMAQNKRSVVISPNGLLSNCEHFSEGEMIFGSIYTDDVKKDVIDYWHQYTKLDECKTCVAYPNCGGVSHCPNLSVHCPTNEKLMKESNFEEAMIKRYYRYKNKIGTK